MQDGGVGLNVQQAADGVVVYAPLLLQTRSRRWLPSRSGLMGRSHLPVRWRVL